MEFTYTQVHTHKQNQNSTKKKYKSMIWQAKNTKNDIEGKKITKTQTGKQNQAECQLGNKAKKTKNKPKQTKTKKQENPPTRLTNMVKKRKKENERKEK